VSRAESIAEIEQNATWQLWAEKGWTLHQAPDGRVLAVNHAGRLATLSVQRFSTLLKQLRNGAFGYKQFVLFKQSHTP
jgi:hypothetical protein